MKKTQIFVLIVLVCLLSFSACEQRKTGQNNGQAIEPTAQPFQDIDDDPQFDGFDAANALRSLTHFLKLHEIDITKDEWSDSPDGHYIMKQYDKNGTLLVTKNIYPDIANKVVGYERYADGSDKLRYYYGEIAGGYVLEGVDQYERGDKYPSRTYKYSTNSGYLTDVLEYDEPGGRGIKLWNYEDGSLSSYATYTYEKEYGIAEKKVFDSYDKQVTQYVQEFDGAGQIIGLTKYDADGNVISHALANYDDEGNIAYTCIYENEALTYELRLIYQNGEADHCEYVFYNKAGDVSDEGRLAWAIDEPYWSLDRESEFGKFDSIRV